MVQKKETINGPKSGPKKWSKKRVQSIFTLCLGIAPTIINKSNNHKNNNDNDNDNNNNNNNNNNNKTSALLARVFFHARVTPTTRAFVWQFPCLWRGADTPKTNFLIILSKVYLFNWITTMGESKNFMIFL